MLKPIKGRPRSSSAPSQAKPVVFFRQRSSSANNVHRISPTITTTLLDLPPELHYAVFEHLDPVDSTCLGLTNTQLYAIHRRLHGRLSLDTGRQGPNDMEWAWRGSGYPGSPLSDHFCDKCGPFRCQLYRHISGFFQKDSEYCAVRQKFVSPSLDREKESCFRSKPRQPMICGRHRKVV
ncbi:hypothetical protein NW752_011647 [Fusarium irregulare]|uniref:F-box domain-containing protein n=1 Tax=Fusarium irregulare TaxID=2494466 RepID=A0A9W8PF01_9HYPO|nr:hypothetical protein NW766_012497 [Fusarium irregulare]KAJ4004550.1 hypothetical protein NW752_011647 [Fusarium irregulare]